ncbi:MAG: hypothetical protein K0R54_700 [Clostridiaceae bacterium]|jgi:hypothetical protein|nr:hypothetical protein [Clostridiaceae bacterium]
MINLSKESIEYINKYFPLIKVREDKILIKSGTYMTIPSKLYPLTNQKTIKLFCYANTEEIEDEKIQEIYDVINIKVGSCYTNSLNVFKALVSNNISDVKTYVGWVIIDEVPIHHCWTVYKDIHVIDGSVEKTVYLTHKYIIENNITDINEQRKIHAKVIIENKKKNNHMVKTFGQVSPLCFYVGTEEYPIKGANIYSELIKKYPDHPSYKSAGMNPNGASTLQKMVLDK